MGPARPVPVAAAVDTGWIGCPPGCEPLGSTTSDPRWGPRSKDLVRVEAGAEELLTIGTGESPRFGSALGSPTPTIRKSVTNGHVVGTEAMSISAYRTIAGGSKVLDRFVEGGVGWVDGAA